MNDTSDENHHGCDIVMSNIRVLCDLCGWEIVGSLSASEPLSDKKMRDLATVALTADFALVNAEGTLHHSQPRALDLAKILSEIRTKFDLPYYVINSTYQDNSAEISGELRHARLVFVRESLSQEELSKVGICSKIVPDLSFYKSFEPIEGVRENYGFTDCVSREKTNALFSMVEKCGGQYLPALRRQKRKFSVLREIVRGVKYYVIGVLGNFSDSKNLNLENYTREKFYVDTYEEYINRIAMLELLVAGRFHSLCFALKTETPFVATRSNSFKIEGMIIDIGLNDSRIIEIEHIDHSSLRQYASYSEEDLERVRKYVRGARGAIQSMFIEIAKDIEQFQVFGSGELNGH